MLSKSKLSFSSIHDDYESKNVKDSVLQIFENLDPEYYISLEDSLKSFIPATELSLIQNGAKAKKLTGLRKMSSACAKMTDENLLAIFAYTFDFGDDKKESNVYRKVNLVLSERRTNDLYNIRGYILHLFSALFRLGDALKVKGATLYRGIDGKKSFDFSGHTPGAERSWPGFTSTSSSSDVVLDDFLDEAETPIMFEIQDAVGYKVSIFSAHGEEDGKYLINVSNNYYVYLIIMFIYSRLIIRYVNSLLFSRVF